MNKKTKKRIKISSSYILLIVVSFLVIMPILLAISMSLQTPGDAMSFPPKLFPKNIYWGNFAGALKIIDIPRLMMNSFLIAIMISVGKLFTGVLSGYAFGNFLFRGSKALFVMLFVTLFLPAETVMVVPLMMIIQKFGWFNTYLGLTIPFMASATNTFIMRQHFLTIPKELEEAARMDGCGPLKYLLKIMVPLSLPIIASMTLVNFVYAWNMYLWPLIATSSDSMKTIQIGVKMLVDTETSSWGEMMAGTLIALLPPLILFFSVQNMFVKSLAKSGLKG